MTKGNWETEIKDKFFFTSFLVVGHKVELCFGVKPVELFRNFQNKQQCLTTTSTMCCLTFLNIGDGLFSSMIPTLYFCHACIEWNELKNSIQLAEPVVRTSTHVLLLLVSLNSTRKFLNAPLSPCMVYVCMYMDQAQYYDNLCWSYTI